MSYTITGDKKGRRQEQMGSASNIAQACDLAGSAFGFYPVTRTRVVDDSNGRVVCSFRRVTARHGPTQIKRERNPK